MFLVAFAASAFGLVVHNLFQAWWADRAGDKGPRLSGFLTLEPKVHLDALGLLFLALLGFGLPRPVPARLYGAKGGQIALMGPAGFFAAALVYGLLARLLAPTGSTLGLSSGLEAASAVMILHAAIYLFPVPPLDGARLVYAMGSAEARRFMDTLASYGPLGFLVIFLVLSYSGITSAIIVGLGGLLSRLFQLAGL